MEGGGIDANFEGSGFAQCLERVLWSFFAAIVCVRGEGMGLVYQMFLLLFNAAEAITHENA